MPKPYYQYERLDLARDAIRLVRLIKGCCVDPIRCELFETFLEEVKGTPYEALSYTWGDQSSTEEIILNRRGALVTSNLHEALCCLRYWDRDRILWIDAICIDQDHKTEKGHQVGQMRFIYKNADNVLVWLGQGNALINKFMAMVSYLDERTTKRPDYRRNSFETWQKEWRVIVEEFGGLHSEVYRQWQAGLSDIVCRSWFQRVWVIQEIANARSATIVCGKNSVATRAFVTIPALLNRVLETHYLSQARAILNIMPGYLRQTSWWNESRDIHTLLKEFRHSRASNQLDRLYALYGLASDLSDGLILRPDYTITEPEALHNIMSYLIFHEVLDNSVYNFPWWNLEEFLDRLDHFFSDVLQWTAKSDGIGHQRVAIKMAQSKLDVNTYDEYGQPPVLYLPQSGCHIEIFQSLLDFPGVNIHATTTEGETALHIAAEKGRIDIVELLLSPDKCTGIDMSRRDNNGETALIRAVLNHHYKIVDYILARQGVATSSKSQRDSTSEPKIVAVFEEDQRIALWYLMNTEEALDISASSGYENIVKLSIQHCVIQYDGSSNGDSMLCSAAQAGQLSIVKLLLEDRTREKTTKASLDTALQLATRQGHTKIVRLLMEHSVADTRRRIRRHLMSGSFMRTWRPQCVII